MRLFAGVELAPDGRAACAATAGSIAARFAEAGVGAAVRWIPERNLHVTLWFFGHADDEAAARIAAALSEPWPLPTFPALIGVAGAFPPTGPPRILWLGLLRGTESFAALHREVGRRVAPLGFRGERRPYHPHVTIGRVTRPQDSARMRVLLRQTAMTPQPLDVCGVTLFESRLSPGGASYARLLRVPLS